MGQQVINPQTGEKFELTGGRWVPVRERGQAPPASDEVEAPKLTEGPVNAALISAGDVFSTVGRNARDVYAMLRGDEKARAKIEGEREEADVMRAMLHEEAPKSAFVGSLLPTLPLMGLGGLPGASAAMAGRVGAPALGTTLGATSTAGRIGQAVAGNAALGAAQSQSGDMGQDAALGALWSLGGMGGANVVQRVMAGRAGMREAGQAMRAATTLTDEEQRIVQGAQRAGLTVLPGQQSGDRVMRQFEASLASNPMTSRVFQDIEQGNAAQLNRLAARAMGVEGADNVGAVVRAQAEHQLAQQFDDIGRRIGPVDTAPLRRTLGELAKEEGTSLLPRTELDSIMARFERGEGARGVAVGGEAADQVSGQALMRERSRISKQMRDAYARNDSSAGDLYGNVLEAMDEAARKAAIRSAKGDPSAGEALARSYDQAREQWSVLRAMDRGGASIEGNVMPGQASRLMNVSDITHYRGRANDIGETTRLMGTGRLGDRPLGDFYDALRFSASQIGRPIVGNSGTATRMAIGEMLTSPTKLATAAAQRLAGMPLARAYANQSPAATQAMFATRAFMKNPELASGFGTGQAAGRIGLLGGM